MSEDADTPLSRFLVAFRTDVEAKSVRPLSEYLARFTGDDVGIAREYVAEVGGPASEGRDPRARVGPADRTRVGPYRTIKEIGRGGQGAVFLAEDTRLRRTVALKVLNDVGTLSASALERFRREAAVASRLDHPGICPVYDVGLDGRTPFIAMKLVEGSTLAAIVGSRRDETLADEAAYFEVTTTGSAAAPDRAKPGAAPNDGASAAGRGNDAADVPRFVEIVEQVARALHVAHEHGVVHRDVKPGNIMITPEGTPVVLDFGLAQDLDADAPTLTQMGDLMGTPHYMSPEQLAAKHIRLDRRTDVWSLGVVLYELAVGRRPFEAPTREGLYQAVMTKAPPDPRSANPHVSPDLRIVIATALEKDRDRRYRTALDFAEDLRRTRMNEPIHAKPAGPFVRLGKWVRRNPALGSALIGLFLALVGGLVATLVLLDLKNAESTLKDAALADYDRLGDVSRHARLTADAEALWPAEPENIPKLRAWLDEAARLRSNFEGHRRARDAMRASPEALPYGDADAAADRVRLRAVADRRAEAAAEREAVLAALEASPPGAAADGGDASAAKAHADDFSPADLRAAVERLDAELATLDARLSERTSRRFRTEAAQFQHDTTAQLVEDLTVFFDPDPAVGVAASVRERLDFAESVERRTLEAYADRWAEAIAAVGDVARLPKYGGLKIAPQRGLIPIGPDPRSGLYEFAHLRTTADGVDPIPSRGPDGRLVATVGTGLIFVLLPGGTFAAGSRPPTSEEAEDAESGDPYPPNVDPESLARESPVHSVTLDPFFISKYEMTQGQWLRVAGRNPSGYTPGTRYGDKRTDLRNPVEQVSWDDCAGEGGWLLRLGLDLPTEAQWEYAARAGTSTPWFTGESRESVEGYGNVSDAFCKANGGPPNWPYEAWNDGHSIHAQVGSYAPNAFGLHDTIGNVNEWCRDGFVPYSESGARSGDGWRDAGRSPRNRVDRGGSFYTDASLARSAVRHSNVPGIRISNLGVRPMRALRPRRPRRSASCA